MKVKLKSGKQYSLKNIGRDELDDMIDFMDINPDTGMPSKPNKSMTFWIRSAVDVKDEDLMPDKMSMEERVELFNILQSKYVLGEEIASSSK